jgi:hypothetical protein
LVWIGLRNDGILYLRAAIQRTIDISSAFLEAFLHEAAQHFEIFSKIQNQN